MAVYYGIFNKDEKLIFYQLKMFGMRRRRERINMSKNKIKIKTKIENKKTTSGK